MRKHKLQLIGVFTVVVIISLNAPHAWGQDSNRLKGRVVDVLGAAIARASVTIKNSERRNTLVTDENGEFEIQLPVGIYEMRTEKMPAFLPSKYAKVRMKRGNDKRVTITVTHTLKDAECVLRITSH